MSYIFTTTVKSIGAEATTFAASNMYVLFGTGVPAELSDYCFNIEMNQSTAEIRPGQKLWIDGKAFPITAVGVLVRKNLDGLGHITLKFDAAQKANLAGTLHIAGDIPTLEVGSTIAIED